MVTKRLKNYLIKNRLYLGIFGGLFVIAILVGFVFGKTKAPEQNLIFEPNKKEIESESLPEPDSIENEEPIIKRQEEIKKEPKKAEPKEETFSPEKEPEVKEPIQPKETVEPEPISETESILELVNQVRVKKGLGQVKENSKLNAAALAKSKDMAVNNYFSHISPSGINDFVFVKSAGYNYQAIGSNIAKGDFESLEDVFSSWMDSPGHRANILADFGVEIGFAQYGQLFTFFIAKPN